MNQEQFGWFWPQLKAPLRAKWEQFTDDDLTQIEGQVDNFNRVTETRYGKKKDEIRSWANRRYAHWTGWYQGYEDPTPSV
jgi:uncharacterized protein YjbJ (UPF0337 family)